MNGAPSMHPVMWGRVFLPHHMPSASPAFHWVLGDLVVSGGSRVAVAAPRGHAKSTLTDLVALLFMLAHGMVEYVLLVSDTAAQANLFLEDLRRECETNTHLIACYPGLAPGRPWSDGDLCFANGARVQGLGAGMKIRGRKHRGKRPVLILVDDLENDDLVASFERRKKLLRWFYASLLPALAPGGRVVVVGTILHSDSLLSRLLRSDSWNRRRWRALSDDNRALWESWRPAAQLLKEKEEARIMGQLPMWYQEFQNQAIADEEAPFRSTDITYFSRLPRDGNGKLVPVTKSLFVDPAISDKDKADFSAFTVVYATHDGFWFVVEAFRKRMDPAEIISTVRRLHTKHQFDVIGIESVAYQKSISFWLNYRSEDDEEDEILPIEEVTPDTDKRRRILALQPYFRAHRIKILEGLSTRLENELLNLDAIDHDDLADSLAGHLFITWRPEPPKVRKKRFDDAASQRAWEHRREVARQARLRRRGIKD